MTDPYAPRTGMAVGHGPVHRPGRPAGRRVFDLPPDQRTAARSWLVHGERRPRAARRASSVAIVRDGPDGVETLLRHRPGPTPLGAVAFPGGSLESFDEDECAWFGPTPAQWSRVLGLDDHRLARRHVAGAIRELFEETGILLAGADPHAVAQNPGGGEWSQARIVLDEQQTTLAALLNRRSQGLRTDLLRAVGRWHTPDFAHRRFDTQYFAAAVPHGQGTSLLADKGQWAAWISVRDVLAGRDGSDLGDQIGSTETAGRRLGELTVPAVELLLELMAAAGSTVEFLMNLTIRGSVPEYTVTLLDTLELEVTVPGGRWGR